MKKSPDQYVRRAYGKGHDLSHSTLQHIYCDAGSPMRRKVNFSLLKWMINLYKRQRDSVASIQEGYTMYSPDSVIDGKHLSPQDIPNHL